MLNVHAAFCVTVTVWFAIVIVPFRCPPVFAAMFSVTDPLPLPDAGFTVTNGALVAVAVHAAGSQFAGAAVTVTVAVLAALPAVTVVGLTVKVHGSVAADDAGRSEDPESARGRAADDAGDCEIGEAAAPGASPGAGLARCLSGLRCLGRRQEIRLRDGRRCGLTLIARINADLHLSAAHRIQLGDRGTARRVGRDRHGRCAAGERRPATPPPIVNSTDAPATGRSLRSRTSTIGRTAVFCWMMLTASSPSITTMRRPPG